ncbi:hypothetical protein ACFPN2_28165 [Steroidobacter flavus]|uniref:Uncharacterized protein n=1 Tax=Steroidobacter flavus TaxID=1842136 RepID=A0ABV8SZB7_9GAMM
MTQETNETPSVVVRVQSRAPQDAGQPSIWRRFAAFTKQLLSFGLWGGTRAAAAKVAQMQARAQKVSAEAARTRARATGVELQNVSRAIELVEKIISSKGSSETKLAQLQLLREADPKLARAIDRLLARYESIIAQGGSISVVAEEPVSTTLSPRRSRRTSQVGMKGTESEPPPSGIS